MTGKVRESSNPREVIASKMASLEYVGEPVVGLVVLSSILVTYSLATVLDLYV